MDTGTSSVSGYSEAWDGTNVLISMTVTGTTSGFFENDDPQQTGHAPTPCDQKVAATFGGTGAVGRTAYDYNGIYRGYDPAAEARLKGSSRIEMGNPLYDSEHLYWFPHLSGNQAGTENTDVYVPGNYQGQPTGPTRGDAVVTFYYPQLFGMKNVTLAVFHVADFGLQKVGDRVRIGRTGGPGGDSGGPSPNRHAHFELWNGRTGFLPPGAKRDAARIPLTSVICPPGK